MRNIGDPDGLGRIRLIGLVCGTGSIQVLCNLLRHKLNLGKNSQRLGLCSSLRREIVLAHYFDFISTDVNTQCSLDGLD